MSPCLGTKKKGHLRVMSFREYNATLYKDIVDGVDAHGSNGFAHDLI